MTNFQLKALIYENKRKERIEAIKFWAFFIGVIIALLIAGTETYPY